MLDHLQVITQTMLVQHQELIFKSNANGQIKGDFLIPNNSQQRFPIGEVQFRLTTSKNNLSNPASVNNATYQAKGTLQTN